MIWCAVHVIKDAMLPSIPATYLRMPLTSPLALSTPTLAHHSPPPPHTSFKFLPLASPCSQESHLSVLCLRLPAAHLQCRPPGLKSSRVKSVGYVIYYVMKRVCTCVISVKSVTTIAASWMPNGMSRNIALGIVTLVGENLFYMAFQILLRILGYWTIYFVTSYHSRSKR